MNQNTPFLDERELGAGKTALRIVRIARDDGKQFLIEYDDTDSEGRMLYRLIGEDGQQSRQLYNIAGLFAEVYGISITDL